MGLCFAGEVRFSGLESDEEFRLDAVRTRSTDGMIRSDLIDRREMLQAVTGDLLNGGVYHVYPCITIHGRRWLIRDVEGPVINMVYDVLSPDYVVLGRPGVAAPLHSWRRG